MKYANKHKQRQKWPTWFFQPTNEESGGYANHDPTAEVHMQKQRPSRYPIEQPHPSTKEHDPDWDREIQPLVPIGLLIESLV